VSRYTEINGFTEERPSGGELKEIWRGPCHLCQLECFRAAKGGGAKVAGSKLCAHGSTSVLCNNHVTILNKKATHNLLPAASDGPDIEILNCPRHVMNHGHRMKTLACLFTHDVAHSVTLTLFTLHLLCFLILQQFGMTWAFLSCPGTNKHSNNGITIRATFLSWSGTLPFMMHDKITMGRSHPTFTPEGRPSRWSGKMQAPTC